MTDTAADTAWRGTSDSRATLTARTVSTPEARLAWLEESLLLAEATGALGRDRARRQHEADLWWGEGR